MMNSNAYMEQTAVSGRTVMIDGIAVHLAFAPEANREIADSVRRILKASYIKRTSS